MGAMRGSVMARGRRGKCVCGPGGSSLLGIRTRIGGGCVGAAQAFGVVLGPLAGTLLYAFDPGAPYWVSGVALLALRTLLVSGPMPDMPPVREPA